jgi:acyl-coenzyme A synthetase/AMP-(fatty) acid ligase
VPKNFIRKLVGYQEKSLQYFRMNPKYNVDFYFNEKLLVDDIFHMDEFTHLRIFGKKTDVIKVTQILMNRLESIKMKSILI